jgi:hypothetical protein
MLAVLQTVVDDVQEAASDAGVAASDVRAYWQALAYVESEDRSWPFSFENICEVIGLDAGGIRRNLRRAPVPQEAPAAVRLEAPAGLTAHHDDACPGCVDVGGHPGD